jgi:hypothetical protein
MWGVKNAGCRDGQGVVLYIRDQLLYSQLAMVVTAHHDEPLRILDRGFLSLNSKFVCALCQACQHLFHCLL